LGAILDQLVNGLATGAVYALVAVGLSLLFKVLDTVNFAHGEFYVLGGVVAFLAGSVLGLDPISTMLLAAALMGVIGALLHSLLRGLLKRNPFNVLLATFAVSLAVLNLVDFAFGGQARTVEPFVTGVVEVGPILITFQRLIAAGGGLIALALIWLWLRRSRSGRSLRAVADNRLGAQILGINTVNIDRMVFAISGACAGLAGALLAPVTQVSAHAGLPVMVTAFVVLVIGGVGSVPGALVGGLLLGAIEGLTAATLGSLWVSLVGYVLLITVLFLRPVLERLRFASKRGAL